MNNDLSRFFSYS